MYVVALLLFFPSVLSAEIYKWVDENGRTHFSEIPPQNKQLQVETIEKNKHRPAEPVPRDGIDRYNQYLESERLEREEQRLQKKQQEDRLEQKCNQLRRRLSDFKAGGVVYYDIDENGNRAFWSDQKLNQEIERLNQLMKRNCKD